jgi:hypothetical protein
MRFAGQEMEMHGGKMKIAVINGGPRLKWNTDMMLNAFEEGIRQASHRRK